MFYDECMFYDGNGNDDNDDDDDACFMMAIMAITTMGTMI